MRSGNAKEVERRTGTRDAAWCAVYERLRSGRGEFLAELRPAFPLFIRFSGMDYDRDHDAIEKLDVFVRSVQRVLTTYGGNLLQLTLGDKGCYLFAVFGSPLAHDADPALDLGRVRGRVEADRQGG